MSPHAHKPSHTKTHTGAHARILDLDWGRSLSVVGCMNALSRSYCTHTYVLHFSRQGFAPVCACVCVRPCVLHAFACVCASLLLRVHVSGGLCVNARACARAHLRLRAFLSENLSAGVDRACVSVQRPFAGTLAARRGPAVVIARLRRADGHVCVCICVCVIGRVIRVAAGVTFTSRTTSAPWGERHGHTTVIDAAGAIYVIGGYDTGPGTLYRDVWASTDGGADRS
jgi:hypothetical protein